MEEYKFEEVMRLFPATPEAIIHALKEVLVGGMTIEEVSNNHWVKKTLLAAYVTVVTSTYANEHLEAQQLVFSFN